MQEVTTVSTLDGYKFKAAEAIKTKNVDVSNRGHLVTNALAMEHLEDK